MFLVRKPTQKLKQSLYHIRSSTHTQRNSKLPVQSTEQVPHWASLLSPSFRHLSPVFCVYLDHSIYYPLMYFVVLLYAWVSAHFLTPLMLSTVLLGVSSSVSLNFGAQYCHRPQDSIYHVFLTLFFALLGLVWVLSDSFFSPTSEWHLLLHHCTDWS